MRLSCAADTRLLTSVTYLPDLSGFMPTRINEAPAHTNHIFTEPFDERDLAAVAGRVAGAFLARFRWHTGRAMIPFVIRCASILPAVSRWDAEIKVFFALGFKNIENFKREVLS